MAIVIQHRALHARGNQVYGVAEGRLYHVDADTGHLRLMNEGVIGEADVHPEDAREFLQYKDFKKVSSGDVPPPPPPAVVSEPEGAEPIEDPTATPESTTPPPPPVTKAPPKKKVIALPDDDVWSIAEWCDADRTGVELTEEETHTRPKAKLVALVREKAKAAR